MKITTHMMSLVLAAVLVVSGIVLPQILAQLTPGYSSAGNYISELGAHGAPNAKVTNYFAFLPVAIASVLLLAILYQAINANALTRIGLAMVCAGVAIGYGVAVVSPCDVGCPAEGSAGQDLHNLGGLAEYGLGILGLLIMSAGMLKSSGGLARVAVIGAALVTVTSFAMMASPEQASLKGMWQRMADYTLFAVIICFALARMSERRP